MRSVGDQRLRDVPLDHVPARDRARCPTARAVTGTGLSFHVMAPSDQSLEVA